MPTLCLKCHWKTDRSKTHVPTELINKVRFFGAEGEINGLKIVLVPNEKNISRANQQLATQSQAAT
jgi:hypothetical protein